MTLIWLILIGAAAVYIAPRIGVTSLTSKPASSDFTPSLVYIVLALVLGVLFWPAIGPVVGPLMSAMMAAGR